ncbi:MAG: DUF1385 domain-containing protein [Thermoleophilia bacterium]|nr:DUF1385 domain-containing protein [Thermoleophilia bacterium]
MPDSHAQHDHDHDSDPAVQPLQLAGMALRNGVLVIGPTHWGAAVRQPDGEIATAVRHRPAFGKVLYSVPGLRGPVRLGEMMAVLPAVRIALPQSRLPMESPRVLAALLLTSGAARIVRRRPTTSIAGAALVELATGALSLGAVLASLASDDLARYHGAEHKAIGGYEQGIAAVDASKEHARCGTHLAVPSLLVNTVALQLAKLLLPRQPGLAAGVGALAGMAASTELARSMQRGGTADKPMAKAMLSVGMRLQSVASTREPDAAQLEVAERALAILLDAEGVPAAAVA